MSLATDDRAADDRAAWTGSDLEGDSSWSHHLTEEHVAELVSALDGVNSKGLQLGEIGAQEFPLPTLAPLMNEVAAELQDGLGFSVLHGLPVERFGLDDLEKMYWGLCTHVGTGITQNSDASLIHYVTDGTLRPNQGTRGVGNPQKSSLHVDLTDCVSLLCVHQAQDDPPSWLGSSVRVHREFENRAPEMLPMLYAGFAWDRLEENGDDESAASQYRVPVFSIADGRVSCRYNRYWMAMAARREADGWTAEEKAALDLFDEIAHENRFELEFQPGDIQFVNNYSVLHGRAGHELEAHEADKRLLMRIWVDFAKARPMIDESIVRYGIVRHGQLGWTATQREAGEHLSSTHARRADGAPLL